MFITVATRATGTRLRAPIFVACRIESLMTCACLAFPQISKVLVVSQTRAALLLCSRIRFIHTQTHASPVLPPSWLSSSLPGFPPSLLSSLLQKLSRLTLNVLILLSTQEQECNQTNTQPGNPNLSNTQPGSPRVDAGALPVRNSTFPVKRDSVTSSTGFVTSVVSAQEQVGTGDKGATHADV